MVEVVVSGGGAGKPGAVRVRAAAVLEILAGVATRKEHPMTFQLRTIAEQVESMGALDRPAEALGKVLRPYLTKRPLKDVLSGTWLGHPLHPVLTDVVIGAWVSAGFLDAFPSKQSSKAADKLILVGCVAALPTAAAGASDWLYVGGKERRVGLVHAAGNVASLILFAWSYLARKRGRRLKGMLLSMAGGGISLSSAFLGGHLSFGMGVGVNQTAFQGDYFEEEPSAWTALMDASGLDELRPGKGAAAFVDGMGIFVYRDGGQLYALSDRCSHRGCSLHTGRVRDGTIVCPCHQSAFRLQDGSVARGPATSPQPAFDVRIVEGRVEVRARK
jgi:nitrite reductase/ring-hydroxylating ferredoxin subunit/uncharacterized membrane protein